jgi:hypothetical protein
MVARSDHPINGLKYSARTRENTHFAPPAGVLRDSRSGNELLARPGGHDDSSRKYSDVEWTLRMRLVRVKG